MYWTNWRKKHRHQICTRTAHCFARVRSGFSPTISPSFRSILAGNLTQFSTFRHNPNLDRMGPSTHESGKQVWSKTVLQLQGGLWSVSNYKLTRHSSVHRRRWIWFELGNLIVYYRFIAPVFPCSVAGKKHEKKRPRIYGRYTRPATVCDCGGAR